MVIVTLKSGQTINVSGTTDADVALYRAKRMGFKAVAARALKGD